MKEASVSQVGSEVFGRHLCLAQQTRECADLQLRVEGHNTALSRAAHDDVTATLPRFLEAKTL